MIKKFNQFYKGFIGSSSIYILSNIISGLVPFILLPILTRYLSPSEYGEIAMFQLLVAALAPVIGLSTAGAVIRKNYDIEGRDLAGYIGACYQLLIASVIVFFFVAYLLGNDAAAALGIKQNWIYIALIVSSAQYFIKIALGQWQVNRSPIKYGVFRNLQSFSDMSLTIIFVVVFSFGADSRVGSIFFTSLVFAILSIYIVRLRYKYNLFVFNYSYIIDAYKYGMGIIPHLFGIFVLGFFDRYIINEYLGLEDTGVYMVAIQFSLAFNIAFDGINKAFVPYLYDKLSKGDNHTKVDLCKKTYIYFFCLASMMVFCALLAPIVVNTIVGDKFTSAGEIVQILLIGQLFFGMYLMLTNYILYKKKNIYLSSITLFSGIVHVVLSIYLISLLGLKGVAIAFVIAMITRFLLTFIVASRVCPMPWFGLIKAAH